MCCWTFALLLFLACPGLAASTAALAIAVAPLQLLSVVHVQPLQLHAPSVLPVAVVRNFQTQSAKTLKSISYIGYHFQQIHTDMGILHLHACDALVKVPESTTKGQKIRAKGGWCLHYQTRRSAAFTGTSHGDKWVLSERGAESGA